MRLGGVPNVGLVKSIFARTDPISILPRLGDFDHFPHSILVAFSKNASRSKAHSQHAITWIVGTTCKIISQSFGMAVDFLLVRQVKDWERFISVHKVADAVVYDGCA